ncbi:MAG: phospholipase A [Pseudomonadota bacterium]
MKPGHSVLFSCLSLLAAMPLMAASGPEGCASIEAGQERLACYDSFFGRDISAGDGVASSVGERESPVLSRRAQEASLLQQWFSITPHRPNYILPATYNRSADYSNYGDFGGLFSKTEIKYQLSLKTRILPNLWRNSSVWAGYTQQSYWQLYADSAASAPFRETNHEPELVWQIPVSFRMFGWDTRIASLAFNHQSNGQIRPLSRSWNRLTGELVMERGRFAASAKTWVRVDDPDLDDNPNIEDFMGRIQLGVAYKGDRHTFAVGLKNNLQNDNRSGIELHWTFPLAQHLKGFVQVYSGYGENLIDMENYNNRIGIGLALTDWL